MPWSCPISRVYSSFRPGACWLARPGLDKTELLNMLENLVACAARDDSDISLVSIQKGREKLEALASEMNVVSIES
jgi:hypothetical protein